MLLRGIERDIDHERGGGRKREEGWVEKGEGREKMEGEDMGGDRRIEGRGERGCTWRGGNGRREDRWGEEIHRERGRVVEGVSGVGGGGGGEEGEEISLIWSKSNQTKENCK